MEDQCSVSCSDSSFNPPSQYGKEPQKPQNEKLGGGGALKLIYTLLKKYSKKKKGGYFVPVHTTKGHGRRWLHSF